MAHEIYQERFLSLRKPAWHRLGQVIEEPIGATAALSQIGAYHVTKEPMFVDVTEPFKPGGSCVQKIETLKANRLGLVAHFPEQKNFLGICDDRYEILQPNDIASVWDMTTESHVETMGILSEGKTIFFSTKLPSYDVKGDEIENYLLVHSPMVPGIAASITITPVRVVCQNTLSWGLDAAKSQHRVIHTKGALNRYGSFLQSMWNDAQAKAEAVKQAMEIMALTRVPAGGVDEYVEELIPYPNFTQASEEEIERGRDLVDKKRRMIHRLYEGRARGAETEAFKGTYFGLYNSVVEYVDYYSHMNKSSVVFGGGASLKQTAFDLALTQ